MAWLEEDPKYGTFKVGFRFGGRRYKRRLDTRDRAEADRIAARLEENIRLVGRGRLELPDGVDLPTFLLSDGKLAGPPKAPEVVTLDDLVAGYRRAHGEAHEDTTLDTFETHVKHLLGTFGGGCAVGAFQAADLQAHIDRRAKQKGRRGRKLSPATMKKELGTLSGIWSWGARMGLVSGPFPSKGLVYPKTTQKPPFQTRGEIERRIARGGLKPDEEAELWDALFLTLTEIDEVLRHVESAARHPFIYPMFVFAAHTGARRSELLRSRIEDLDFAARVVTVREKKRVKGRRTYRRVPMSPLFEKVMRAWLDEHPGGAFTIAQALQIARSRKTRAGYVPLTVDEANDHFHRTLEGSRWTVIRGFHVFRHSFASNCAARGVDQRLINAWLGHQTAEMVERYRHLIPSHSASALEQVFGAPDGP
jgi:integrase